MVEPKAGADARLLDGFAGKLTRLKAAMDVLNGSWPQGWSPDSVIEALQTGDRIRLNPTAALEELQKFHALLPQVVTDIQNMKEIDAPTRARALAHLGETAKPAAQ